MFRTRDEFFRATGSLSKRNQTALACASAEHVLPLYELHYGILSKRQKLAACEWVRAALDKAWRYALGEDLAESEIDCAFEAASQAIPHIDLDSSDIAEMCMSASVAVLEALEVTSGKRGSIPDHASFSAVTAVMVGCYIRDSELEHFQDIIFELNHEALMDSGWDVLKYEWSLQNALLSELLNFERDQIVTLEWKENQAMHGVLITKKLGWV